MVREITAAINEYLQAADSLTRWQPSAGEATPVLDALRRAHRNLLLHLDQFETSLAGEGLSASKGMGVRRPAMTRTSPLKRKVVMVPIDRGLPSQWAVRTAGDMAAPFEADVVLVHVLADVVDGFAAEIVYGQTKLRNERRRRAKELLRAARSHFDPDVRVDELVREGVPGAEIVTTARERTADLVVMGTHGRGRLSGFLLGSTTQTVIKGAPCPVVVVAHDPELIHAKTEAVWEGESAVV